ncbi:MAG: hypothetical protein ACRDD1_17950, partial [Planctomycetia bacterium]
MGNGIGRLESTATVFLLAAAASAFAQGTKDDYERAAGLDARFRGKVRNETLVVHWFDDARKLWCKVDRPDGRGEIVVVDAESGKKSVVSETDLPKSAEPSSPKPGNRRRDRSEHNDGAADSPDGRWTAFRRDYDVWVRSKADGKEKQLS